MFEGDLAGDLRLTKEGGNEAASELGMQEDVGDEGGGVLKDLRRSGGGGVGGG